MDIPQVFNLEFKGNVLQDVPEFVPEFLNKFADVRDYQDRQLDVVSEQLKDIDYTDIKICRLITELYFAVPLKQPLKKFLKRLTQKTDNTESLELALNQTVKTNLRYGASAKTPEDLYALTCSLCTCLDLNFGTKVIENHLEDVIAFIKFTFLSYMTMQANTSSPIEIAQLKKYFHFSTRFALSCLQQFGRRIDEDTNQVLKRFEILQQCYLHFFNNDLNWLLDTKVNMGIYLALHSHFRNKGTDLLKPLTDSKNILIFQYMGILHAVDARFIKELSMDKLACVVAYVIRAAASNTVDINLNLAVSKSISHLTKHLISPGNGFTPDMPTKDRKLLELILCGCLEYSYVCIEHYVDSIRHVGRAINEKLFSKAKDDENYTFLVSQAVKDYHCSGSSDRLLSIITLNLSNVLGTGELLNRIPTLKRDIFDYLVNRDWSNTIIDVVVLDKATNSDNIQDIENWYQFWIIGICEKILQEERRRSITTLKRIEEVVTMILKRLVNNSKIMDYILINLKEVPLRFYLLVAQSLKCGKQSNFTIDYNKLQLALLHYDENIRVLGFRILIESQKTTMPIENETFNCIGSNLTLNSTSKSAGFRHKIHGLMLKLFNRIEKSCYAIKEEESTYFIQCRNFLSFLISILMEHLEIGANYDKRAISLLLLKETLHCMNNLKLDEQTVWERVNLSLLFENLKLDTYESNKDLLIQIFSMCPDDRRANFLKTRVDELNLFSISTMLTSIKPADSLTATYLIHLTELPIKYITDLKCSSFLLETLKAGHAMAKENLFLASSQDPIYGTLFTINYFFTKMEFNPIAENQTTFEIWQNIFKEIIDISQSLIGIVGPVVNSSAPEGHLPNDFTSVFEENGKYRVTDSVDIGKQPGLKAIGPTSQLILLCAWRIVKELSLMLGNLILKSQPITYVSDEGTNVLISPEQILLVADLFKQMIFETKHRGAFEQAYVGFCSICCYMWRSTDPKMFQMPFNWLETLITLISGQSVDEIMDVTKLCSTRRSAGVPFMIQAILINEYKELKTTNCLKYCMDSLFQLIYNENSSSEAKSHCLNILRSLFKCTQLGEACGIYVEDGMQAAIKCTASENWNERNSSSLLFSALIIRIFGVPRSKNQNDLDSKNKLSTKLFFSRYPKLYEFIHTELKEIREALRLGMNPLTYQPILILLKRLYPVAMDLSETDYDMTEIIDIISECCYSPVLIMRETAASVMVNLVSDTDIDGRLAARLEHLNILTEYYNTENITFNHIHGVLMQILQLVKLLVSPERKFIFTPQCQSNLKLFYTIINNFEIKFSNDYHPYIDKVFYEILVEWLSPEKKIHISKMRPMTEELGVICERLQAIIVDGKFKKDAIASTVKYQLVHFMQLQRILGIKPLILYNNWNHNSIDYLDTMLNIIYLIVNDTDTKFPVFYNITCEERAASLLRSDWKLRLSESKLPIDVLKIIKNSFLYPVIYEKAIVILSFIGNDVKDDCPIPIEFFEHWQSELENTKLADSLWNAYACAYLRFSMNYNGLSTEDSRIDSLFDLFSKRSVYEMNSYLKSLILDEIYEILNYDHQQNTSQNCLSLAKISWIILTLIRDESNEVTDKTIKVVNLIVNDDNLGQLIKASVMDKLICELKLRFSDIKLWFLLAAFECFGEHFNYLRNTGVMDEQTQSSDSGNIVVFERSEIDHNNENLLSRFLKILLIELGNKNVNNKSVGEIVQSIGAQFPFEIDSTYLFKKVSELSTVDFQKMFNFQK